MKQKIIVATTNKHKLKEIKNILKCPVVGYSLSVRENGKTFEANAIKKAKAVAKKVDEIVIADDSGLMVDALYGGPGVKSARFANPSTRENLCNKLIRLLKNKKNRSAKFVCVIAVVFPDGKVKTVKGVCPGQIIDQMKGPRGFGYDPVFIPRGYKKTFGEMKPSLKNCLSHRGRALKKLKEVF